MSSRVETVFAIDAGSSKSELFAYEVSQDGTDELPRVRAIDVVCRLGARKIEDPLHALGQPKDKKSDVKDYLQPLLECVKSFPRMPAKLHLLATAGMRDNRKSEEQGDILADVRTAILDRGLPLGEVRVISGEEEGLFAWLAVNNEDGRLGQSVDALAYGVVELGGSSAQIAFAALAAPQQSLFPVRTPAVSYGVYAHSGARCGLESARLAVAEAACFPKGCGRDDCEVAGAGDFVKCQSQIMSKLGRQDATQHCSLASFAKARPSGDFYALGAYAKITDLLKPSLPVGSFLIQLDALGRSRCNRSWETLLRERAPEGEARRHLANSCFAISYVSLMLQRYGFDVGSTNSIREPKSGVNWTQGAVLARALTGKL